MRVFVLSALCLTLCVSCFAANARSDRQAARYWSDRYRQQYLDRQWQQHFRSFAGVAPPSGGLQRYWSRTSGIAGFGLTPQGYWYRRGNNWDFQRYPGR